MITIQVSELIKRPVAEVYAFAGCYDNDTLWRTGVARQPGPSGMPQAGMRYHETMTYSESRFAIDAIVEAVEPNRRTAFRTVAAAMPMRGQRLFEPVGDHTRFTYELTIEPTGVYQLLPALTKELFTRQIRQDLARLRQRMAVGVARRSQASALVVAAS